MAMIGSRPAPDRHRSDPASHAVSGPGTRGGATVVNASGLAGRRCVQRRAMGVAAVVTLLRWRG